MNATTRRSAVPKNNGQGNETIRRDIRNSVPIVERLVGAGASDITEGRARVYVAAANRLLRQALSQMLMKQGDMDVAGLNSAGPFRVEERKADLLLLTSRGSPTEDINVIRQVRI